jgi:hypothetical protein
MNSTVLPGIAIQGKNRFVNGDAKFSVHHLNGLVEEI